MGGVVTKRQSFTPGEAKASGYVTATVPENGDLKNAGVNGQADFVAKGDASSQNDVISADNDGVTTASSDRAATTSQGPSSPNASVSSPVTPTDKKSKKKGPRFVFSLRRTGSGKRSRKSRPEANGIRPTSYPAHRHLGAGHNDATKDRPHSLFLEELPILEDDGKIETVSLSSNEDLVEDKTKDWKKPASQPSSPSGKREKKKDGSQKKKNSKKKKDKESKSKVEKQKKDEEAKDSGQGSDETAAEKEREVVKESVVLAETAHTEQYSPQLQTRVIPPTATLTTGGEPEKSVGRTETKVPETAPSTEEVKPHTEPPAAATETGKSETSVVVVEAIEALIEPVVVTKSHSLPKLEKEKSDVQLTAPKEETENMEQIAEGVLQQTVLKSENFSTDKEQTELAERKSKDKEDDKETEDAERKKVENSKLSLSVTVPVVQTQGEPQQTVNESNSMPDPPVTANKIAECVQKHFLSESPKNQVEGDTSDQKPRRTDDTSNTVEEVVEETVVAQTRAIVDISPSVSAFFQRMVAASHHPPAVDESCHDKMECASDEYSGSSAGAITLKAQVMDDSALAVGGVEIPHVATEPNEPVIESENNSAKLITETENTSSDPVPETEIKQVEAVTKTENKSTKFVTETENRSVEPETDNKPVEPKTENKPAEPVAETENKPAEPVAETENKPAEPVAEAENKPAESVTDTENKPAESVTETEYKPVELVTETENKSAVETPQPLSPTQLKALGKELKANKKREEKEKAKREKEEKKRLKEQKKQQAKEKKQKEKEEKERIMREKEMAAKVTATVAAEAVQEAVEEPLSASKTTTVQSAPTVSGTESAVSASARHSTSHVPSTAIKTQEKQEGRDENHIHMPKLNTSIGTTELSQLSTSNINMENSITGSTLLPESVHVEAQSRDAPEIFGKISQEEKTIQIAASEGPSSSAPESTASSPVSPSSPTSPFSDEHPSDTSSVSAPASPVSPETGESARPGGLKKIVLGPRLRTAILRKSSSGAESDEKRVSLTQPRNVQVSELTPPPRKQRPRRPLEQAWTPMDKRANKSPIPASPSQPEACFVIEQSVTVATTSSVNQSSPLSAATAAGSMTETTSLQKTEEIKAQTLPSARVTSSPSREKESEGFCIGTVSSGAEERITAVTAETVQSVLPKVSLQFSEKDTERDQASSQTGSDVDVKEQIAFPVSSETSSPHVCAQLLHNDDKPVDGANLHETEGDRDYKVMVDLPSPESRVSIHSDPSSPTVVSVASIVLASQSEVPDTVPSEDAPHQPADIERQKKDEVEEEEEDTKTEYTVKVQAETKEGALEEMVAGMVSQAHRDAQQQAAVLISGDMDNTRCTTADKESAAVTCEETECKHDGVDVTVYVNSESVPKSDLSCEMFDSDKGQNLDSAVNMRCDQFHGTDVNDGVVDGKAEDSINADCTETDVKCKNCEEVENNGQQTKDGDVVIVTGKISDIVHAETVANMQCEEKKDNDKADVAAARCVEAILSAASASQTVSQSSSTNTNVDSELTEEKTFFGQESEMASGEATLTTMSRNLPDNEASCAAEIGKLPTNTGENDLQQDCLKGDNIVAVTDKDGDVTDKSDVRKAEATLEMKTDTADDKESVEEESPTPCEAASGEQQSESMDRQVANSDRQSEMDLNDRVNKDQDPIKVASRCNGSHEHKAGSTETIDAYLRMQGELAQTKASAEKLEANHTHKEKEVGPEQAEQSVSATVGDINSIE